MRSSLAALLFVMIVAGCSESARTGAEPTSTRAVAAPRIKPPFLPTSAAPGSVATFRCPKHPISTIEMQSCSGRRILALNARINARIKVIWSRLGDATGRSHFATGERAWRVYVKNECISRSRAWIDPASPNMYVGGTAAPLQYGLCREDLTAAHLRQLNETAAALAPR